MIRKKIVIGITGASGAIYAENLVNRLHQHQDQVAELGIVLSENAVNKPPSIIAVKPKDAGVNGAMTEPANTVCQFL